jgi:hypothetical protein
MRGLKRLGCVLLLVVGMSVAVLPTTGAMAAKLLTLTSEGTAVPVGAPGDVGLIIDECVIFSSGTVTANDAAKDKVVTPSSLSSECPEEKSASGFLTEAQLGSNGKATMKGTVVVTDPGPCTYKYTKFKGTFTIPGITFISAMTTGKLEKKVSSPSCAKTATQHFVADATNSEQEPFEAEL